VPPKPKPGWRDRRTEKTTKNRPPPPSVSEFSSENPRNRADATAEREHQSENLNGIHGVFRHNGLLSDRRRGHKSPCEQELRDVPSHRVEK
jgi:hypothetical protein